MREVQRSQPDCDAPKKWPRRLRELLERKHVEPGHHD
jgi:hypothetical protein